MTANATTTDDAPSTAAASSRPLPDVGWGRADLQVHSASGDGMASAAQIFDAVERLGLLDVVAITDHDDVEGALIAREVHARGRYHFDFVPGIEVTTRGGHLLALWVDQPVPSFRSLGDTVEEIHRQGGLAVIPHPFSLLTRSVGRRGLQRLVTAGDSSRVPDGLEVENPTSAGWDAGKRARRLNEERWQLATTGGSDAHFLEALGSAYTLFPGRTGDDLRRAILERRTVAVGGRKPSLREIGWGTILRQQARGLSVTPRKVLGRVARRSARGTRASGASTDQAHEDRQREGRTGP
jgi:predicted metal-dependent phosphoesterase TrpH